MSADPLAALFLPLATGAVPLLGRNESVLFLNARLCGGLSMFEQCMLTPQQYFKPLAEELCAFTVTQNIPDREYDLVLLAGTHQHDETLFLMASGLKALKPGGTFVCAAANDMGGKRLKKDAASFGLSCDEEGKFHSRVIWGQRPTQLNENALAQSIRDGSLQSILGNAFLSQPGIFGWNKIDEGSALLAKILPGGAFTGKGADFGCGYGYLSRHLLDNNPGIERLHCLDADSRAVEACAQNTRKYSARVECLWADIVSGVPLPNDLDWVVANPPFHHVGNENAGIGRAFIASACRSLKPGGKLWMVANAHLAYEKTLNAHFDRVEKLMEKNGYKIFFAQK